MDDKGVSETEFQIARLAASVWQANGQGKMIKFELNNHTMKRDKAIETIKELPNEFDLEELMEKLVFVEKVEKGLKQLDDGKTVTHETVKETVKKW